MADIILPFLNETDSTSISTKWGLLLLSWQLEIQRKDRNEAISALDKNGIDYKLDLIECIIWY